MGEHGVVRKLEHLTFNYLDYSLFTAMLIISALIGMYFGIYKKQNSTSEYLLGGRNMGVFPVAISLAASYVSAIMLLGMPTEIYTYGGQYSMSCIAGILMSVVIGKVYLPVFYKLQLTSSFEYLALRFDNSVRLTASFLCLVGLLLNIPIVMYVPALAFNLVSGIEIKYITPLVCFICIFYTAVGGLKAVVWTDTLQFVTTNGAILAILVLGTPNEGGLARIWKIAEENDRVHFFDTDPSMYSRATMWSVTIGMGLGWVSSMGVNQMCIQRFLSVPSLADANKVLYIYCGAVTIIKGLCLFAGFIIYARYSGCDPLSAGIIERADQILPYYVMDTAKGIPGLPGLFIAGVFGAALSTMSSLLNTACGVIYKDFISMAMPKDTSDERASTIMKFLVVVTGCLCMMMVYWVEKLGNILQLAISFSGLTSGAMLGTFSLGMLFTRANSKGTIIGAMTSLIFMFWVLYGNNQALSSKAIQYPTKPFSIDECIFDDNYTMPTIAAYTKPIKEDEVFFLYRISFMWYNLIGTSIVFLVGLPISYMTEPPTEAQTKPEYFSPVIERFLPKHIKDRSKDDVLLEKPEYKPVEVIIQEIKETVLHK